MRHHYLPRQWLCGDYVYQTMHPLFVAEVRLAKIPTVLNCGGYFVPISIVSFFRGAYLNPNQSIQW